MKYTSGKWEVGLNPQTVIANTNDVDGFQTNTGHLDTEYYGGILICESVFKIKDAQLIALSPEMFEIIDSLENDNNSIPEPVWKRIQEIKNYIKN